MVRHGHRVTAVLASNATELADRARDMGLDVERVRVRAPYMDLVAARVIRGILRRRKIDVVLAARTRDLSTAMLGAGRIPVVLYHQMQSGINKRDWSHNWMYRRLSAAIVITERQRDQLIATTVLDPARIHVIPYGVDRSRFTPARFDPAAARERFGIPPDAFVVGIVGGFSEGKGQADLLQALHVVSEHEPSRSGVLWGLFVGERTGDRGAYADLLRKTRAALPFADRIVFTPFIDDPAEAYRAMDIFVLASHAETFGMVVQEAMSMGCAVVATNAGGVPEIITDGHDGLLVHPRSPPAIADAIVRLWRDDDMRRRLAENAVRTVEVRFDPTIAYDRFVAVLADVMKRAAC